ncbi:MAG: cytochrome c3 family protein [Sphingobacteriaceae bacterium]
MRSISLFFRSVVRTSMLFLCLGLLSLNVANAQTAAEGAALFKQKCTSCHALNQKMVGPALKGVHDRHDEAWLLKWIKNSQAMVAAGDPAALKIYNEYNKVAMTAFPELSDDDIKGVLAYIKEEGDKPAAPAAGAAAGGEAKSDEVSNMMIGGIIILIIVAFMVILVLNKVIAALQNLFNQKQGIKVDVAEPKNTWADCVAGVKNRFKNKKFTFVVVLLAVLVLTTAALVGMWNTGVHQGYQPVQPIKFSHQLHAGVNQISCQYCHSGAFKSKNASIPSLNVCMNCHNYVQATEKYDGKISPEILKIYSALDYNPDTKVYGDNPKPVEWIRIHNLPDLAYFNHAQHVKVAGIQCQKCHGPIQNMEEVYQYAPLTMKWCINCHKETEVNHKGNAYYDKLIAAHEQLKKGEKITAAVLGGIECGKCHY